MTELPKNIETQTDEQLQGALGEKISKVEDFKISTKEALDVKNELENIPEVVSDAKDQVGKLQKISELLGRKTRAVVFAFSMLMASQAKEAMANEPKAGAKVEMQQIDLDQIKQRYQVPDAVEKLKEFESPVEFYLGVSQGIQEIIQNWKNLDESQRKQFFKALKDIPDGETYAKSRDSEARLAEDGYIRKSGGIILQLQEISRYEPIQVAKNGK